MFEPGRAASLLGGPSILSLSRDLGAPLSQDAVEFIQENPREHIGAIDLFAGKAQFTRECRAKGVPVRTYEMEKTGYPPEWGDVVSGDDDILTGFGLFRFRRLRLRTHVFARHLPCCVCPSRSPPFQRLPSRGFLGGLIKAAWPSPPFLF